MKAEHRKELETNVLADRMGRLVERIKTRPRRLSVLYVILAVLVVLGLFVWYRLSVGSQEEEAKRWLALEQGESSLLFKLGGFNENRKTGGIGIVDEELTNPGKAARFHVAHFFVWEQGIQRLGGEPARALESLRFAQTIYNQLKKECENDPFWLPEALYNLAVIEETLAIQNPTLPQGMPSGKVLELVKQARADRLNSAQKKFEDLASAHKDSGFGKLADKRAKELKENHDDIEKTYANFQFNFHVPDEKPVIPKLAPALP